MPFLNLSLSAIFVIVARALVPNVVDLSMGVTNRMPPKRCEMMETEQEASATVNLQLPKNPLSQWHWALVPAVSRLIATLAPH